MAENGNGKWQLAFWIVTGFMAMLGTFSLSGYFQLDNKIAYAEENVRKERAQALDKIETKIEKVDLKVEAIRLEQRAMREESQDQYREILIALEQLKKKP